MRYPNAHNIPQGLRSHRRTSNNENDTLAILSFLADNPDFYQTTESIGAAVGLSHQRVSHIFTSVEKWGPNDACLNRTASKYGFSYKFIHKKGKIIDVIRTGRLVCV